MIYPFSPFTGLDLRPGAVDQQGALKECYNLIVNDAGALVRRPAMRFRVRAPADTAGLYSVGDSVRCVAKTGTSGSGLAPSLSLDYISGEVSGGVVLGTGTDSGAKTILLFRRADDSTAIHHCGVTGVDSGYVSPVTFPGTPDFAFACLEGRAWGFDAQLQKLNYSELDDATPESLDNWTPGEESNKAGFLSVGQFSAGSGTPRGIGDFGGRMAIFYDNALQIWRLDTDQSRIFKESAVGGIGTIHPRSIASVGTDIILVTNTGVRSLTTVTTTLDPKEDDTGSRVDAIINEYANDTGADLIGLYARRLGCYLVASGKNIVCLSLTPGKGINGWSRWYMPVTIDAMCESQGLVWVRSGRNIFTLEQFDKDHTDENSTEVDVPVRWEPVQRRVEGEVSVNRIILASTEDVRAQCVVDGKPVADDPPGLPGSLTVSMPSLPGLPITLPGRSPSTVEWTVGKKGRTISLRGQDDATSIDWRLEICAVDASLLSSGN